MTCWSEAHLLFPSVGRDKSVGATGEPVGEGGVSTSLCFFVRDKQPLCQGACLEVSRSGTKNRFMSTGRSLARGRGRT